MASEPSQNPDLSEFLGYSKPYRQRCPIKDALADLKGDEKAQLAAALEADKDVITGVAVTKWLDARGFTGLNPQHISAHRRQVCSCAR